MSKAELIYDEIMCECENAIDNFDKTKFNLYQKLIVLKPAKKLAAQIANQYKALQDELNELIEDKTEDLVEAYSHLKVPQRKKLLAVVTSLIDDATSYSATKRKVRVKRPISFEKIVSKLKYKQTDVDFKVSSIDPAIIPQSQILLVFNTKYRFLFIYQAKEGEQLSVKGTTLLNFDEDKSFKKRIRKPELILGKIQQTTKLRAVKMFGEAKSKPGPATGRINSDCILLRAIDKL